MVRGRISCAQRRPAFESCAAALRSFGFRCLQHAGSGRDGLPDHRRSGAVPDQPGELHRGPGDHDLVLGAFGADAAAAARAPDAGEVEERPHDPVCRRSFPHEISAAIGGDGAGSELYNLYGPTETNVCTYYKVERERLASMEKLPIGIACANTDTFAVTTEGQLAATGREPASCMCAGRA